MIDIKIIFIVLGKLNSFYSLYIQVDTLILSFEKESHKHPIMHEWYTVMSKERTLLSDLHTNSPVPHC